LIAQKREEIACNEKFEVESEQFGKISRYIARTLLANRVRKDFQVVYMEPKKKRFDFQLINREEWIQKPGDWGYRKEKWEKHLRKERERMMRNTLTHVIGEGWVVDYEHKDFYHRVDDNSYEVDSYTYRLALLENGLYVLNRQKRRVTTHLGWGTNNKHVTGHMVHENIEYVNALDSLGQLTILEDGGSEYAKEKLITFALSHNVPPYDTGDERS
jgi:hypothetical protein